MKGRRGKGSYWINRLPRGDVEGHTGKREEPEFLDTGEVMDGKERVRGR